jgi:hypothetical protein
MLVHCDDSSRVHDKLTAAVVAAAVLSAAVLNSMLGIQKLSYSGHCVSTLTQTILSWRQYQQANTNFVRVAAAVLLAAVLNSAFSIEC